MPEITGLKAQTNDGLPILSSIRSPAEALFVDRSVLLQQCSELKQGELLEQIHLKHRLAADLEWGRSRTGLVGVLEAWPTEFLRPGAWRQKS